MWVLLRVLRNASDDSATNDAVDRPVAQTWVGAGPHSCMSGPLPCRARKAYFQPAYWGLWGRDYLRGRRSSDGSRMLRSPRDFILWIFRDMPRTYQWQLFSHSSSSSTQGKTYVVPFYTLLLQVRAGVRPHISRLRNTPVTPYKCSLCLI